MNLAEAAPVVLIGAGKMGGALARGWVANGLPPAQLGKGMTGVFAGPGATAKDKSLARLLLRAAGESIWIEDEALLDVITAVSGSGPAYVFHLVEALAEAAQAEGLDAATAMALARQTVIGSAALLEADPAPASELRQNVTSPGGTTAAALKILMDEKGLTALMKRAVAAARQRSQELGR